jgi:hypothetical protein
MHRRFALKFLARFVPLAIAAASASESRSSDPAKGASAAGDSAFKIRRAVDLSRAYLECVDDDRRRHLANGLAEFDGDINEVLSQLKRQEFKPGGAGYHARPQTGQIANAPAGCSPRVE